jgi:hypothetical protein
MTETDRPRFVAAMNWLARKYPIRQGQELVPRKLPVEDLNDWFAALRDIHIERIEWAAKHHYGRSEFFPKPCNLREAAPLAPAPKGLPIKGQRQIAEQAEPTPESTRHWRQMLDELKLKMGIAS